MIYDQECDACSRDLHRCRRCDGEVAHNVITCEPCRGTAIIRDPGDVVFIHTCGCPRGVGEDVRGHNPATCTRWERT